MSARMRGIRSNSGRSLFDVTRIDVLVMAGMTPGLLYERACAVSAAALTRVIIQGEHVEIAGIDLRAGGIQAPAIVPVIETSAIVLIGQPSQPLVLEEHPATGISLQVEVAVHPVVGVAAHRMVEESPFR